MKNWNKDIIWKIVSLFLALFMWLYVVDVQNPQTETIINDIPIKYVNEESIENFGLVLVNDSSKSLSLKVSGRRKSLSALNNENIKAYADLKGLYNSGEFPVMVQVNLPQNNVKVIDMKPYNINVEIDKITKVQKTITVVTRGELKDPYVALEPEVIPNLITFEGPSSVVDSINSVRAYVDIEGKTKDIVTNQEFAIYNNEDKRIMNENIKSDVNSVKIVCPIRIKKTVNIKPDIIGSPAGSFVLEGAVVNPSTIEIVGKEKDIEEIELIKTEPINISNLSNNKTFNAELVLPNGINIYGENKPILVNISIDKEIMKTFSIRDINVYGLSDDKSYTLLTDELKITVKGKEKTVMDLQEEDISTYIHLSEYDEGEHIVPVRVSAGANIEIMGNYNALVRISRQAKEPKETDTDTETETE